MEYKTAFIGTCINDDGQHNMKNGTPYLLKDRKGDGEIFFVYQLQVNRFYGCYPSSIFEVEKELTPEEAEALMEHPVNYWGLNNNGEVIKPTERFDSIPRGINVPEPVLKPEIPKAKVEIKPDVKPKVSKPVQKSLFG